MNQTTTPSLINIVENRITMGGNNQGDEGIIFATIQSPMGIGISNNLIRINDNNPTNGGTGIDFQSIIGTFGLTGPRNNIISVDGRTNGGSGAPWVTGLSRSNLTAGSGIFVKGFAVP